MLNIFILMILKWINFCQILTNLASASRFQSEFWEFIRTWAATMLDFFPTFTVNTELDLKILLKIIENNITLMFKMPLTCWWWYSCFLKGPAECLYLTLICFEWQMLFCHPWLLCKREHCLFPWPLLEKSRPW